MKRIIYLCLLGFAWLGGPQLAAAQNVGIGLTTPAGLLHLYSPASYVPSYAPTNGRGELLLGNGTVTSGASLQFLDGGNYGGGLLFNVHAATGSNNWPTGTSTALTLLPSGFVGVGTMTPGAQLEVAGQVKLTGGSPALGKVLVSDATGLASWQPGTGIAGVTTGDESLRLLRGLFQADGTRTNGAGYTVQHTGLGTYTITFTTAFADAPSVGFTSNSATALIHWTSLSASAVALAVTNLSGLAVDLAAGQSINFTATGGR